jgi:hypothetical protein
MRGLVIARDLSKPQSFICQEPSHTKGFGLGSSRRHIAREPRSRDLSVDNASQ